jgi:hypothetical protein
MSGNNPINILSVIHAYSTKTVDCALAHSLVDTTYSLLFNGVAEGYTITEIQPTSDSKLY